jgi:hypothetical protein
MLDIKIETIIKILNKYHEGDTEWSNDNDINNAIRSVCGDLNPFELYVIKKQTYFVSKYKSNYNEKQLNKFLIKIAKFYKSNFIYDDLNDYPVLKSLVKEYYDKKQESKCFICKRPFGLIDNRLSDEFIESFLDHNHSNGFTRGLLCRNCNMYLGWIKENPVAILRIFIYLFLQ